VRFIRPHNLNVRDNKLVGHSAYFYKFINGKAVSVSFDDIKTTLSKYGKLAEFGETFALVRERDVIGDEISLDKDNKGGICGIQLSRPYHDEEYFKFVFDVIKTLGMCHFDDDMEYIFSNSDISEEVPVNLLEQIQNGIKIVDNIDDL